MIQAPNMQYIPAQQIPQVYQGQGAEIIQYPQQQQMPGTIYNYPTSSCYAPQTSASGKPQFNGVNIEINNPQGQGLMPAQYYPMMQPYTIPVQQPVTQQPVAPQPYPMPQQPQVAPQPSPMPVQPPVVPAPQVSTPEPAPAIPAAPVVDQPVAPDAAKTAESFAGRLKTDNIDEQNDVIEEIAKAVKHDPALGKALLDTQIFDALVDIIDKDTSTLEGPSPEVLELRNKPKEELSKDELALASTPSPLEKAEINKQYALYTISYMQQLLNDELEKNNGQALELKDLPCIEKVIESAKSNPNPEVRVSALASLSHIARPQYKDDLTQIFELAKADESDRVKKSAETALDVLNGQESTEQKAA